MPGKSSRALLLVGLVTGLVVTAAACGTTVPQAELDAASRGTGEAGIGGAVPVAAQQEPAGTATTAVGSPPSTTGPVASGGGSGSGGTAGPVTGPTSGAAVPTAKGPSSGAAHSTAVSSSAANTSPLSIGIVYTGTSNSSSFGYTAENTVTEQNVDKALIDAYNKQGGLAGRRLVPVYAPTDTGSSSWNNDFQAACSTFTQDHHVAAVLGYQFTYIPGFESCLNKAGVPHLETGFNVPDATELDQYPLHRALQVPTIERRQLAKFDGAIATGVLTPANKLGVLLDSCPGSERSWNAVTKPFLDAHHINVAYTTVTSCVDGANSSQSDAVAQIPSAILALRSKGIDRIAFAATSEGPVLFVLSIAAQAQGYHPTYIMSSLGNLAQLQNQMPRPQAENVKGFGWIPDQDVAPSQYPAQNPSQKRCTDMLKSQGLTLSSAADYDLGYRTCEAFFVYERALQATHGDSTGSAVIKAVDAIGTSYQSATSLDGRSVYTNARRNSAPDSVRPVVFNDGCSCFTYSGASRPMP